MGVPTFWNRIRYGKNCVDEGRGAGRVWQRLNNNRTRRQLQFWYGDRNGRRLDGHGRTNGHRDVDDPIRRLVWGRDRRLSGFRDLKGVFFDEKRTVVGYQ